MNIPDVLQKIGLTPKQGELYLASLRIGSASVLSLSKATKLHRPILYKLLEEMVDEGIFVTTIVGKRKLYTAIDPKQLMSYLRNKENLLKEALPEMLALSNIGSKRPKIQYYEGREQLRGLYRSTIEEHPKEVLTYFPSKYMMELFGKREMEEVIQDRIKRGIRTKTLRGASTEIDFEGSKEREKALREVRYLPKDITLGMGVIISNNSVSLFSPIEEDYGMQIDSKSYAEIMRCFFNALWNNSTQKT